MWKQVIVRLFVLVGEGGLFFFPSCVVLPKSVPVWFVCNNFVYYSMNVSNCTGFCLFVLGCCCCFFFMVLSFVGTSVLWKKNHNGCPVIRRQIHRSCRHLHEKNLVHLNVIWFKQGLFTWHHSSFKCYFKIRSETCQLYLSYRCTYKSHSVQSVNGCNWLDIGEPTNQNALFNLDFW